MIELISVLYAESANSSYSSKRYPMNERRSASAFARLMSKSSGCSASLYKTRGYYSGGLFYEVEATHLISYENGKKR